MSNLLTVTDLSMAFGGLIAVDHVSFSVKLGSITAMIGPNGAGKTTVFNCLTRFYNPTSGKIQLTPEPGYALDLHTLSPYKVAKKARVLRTFQNIRLFGQMSVLENVLVGQHSLLMRASSCSVGGLLNLPRYRKAEKDAMDLALFWLDIMGLKEDANRTAASLPYGAQRRLEMARCLAGRPRLLCLDEPAAGLNPKESLDLKNLLKTICYNHGVTIFLIEHDMSVVMDISDHILVLDYGRLLAEGTPAFVRSHPDVIRAYLGEDAVA
jgi:branched-chain amino acid transport system ATP-binding protein